MTSPFFLFANLMLLLRLPLLLGDRPVRQRGWVAKALAELLLVFSFKPAAPAFALALGVVLINGLSAWWDTRRGDRVPGHLVLGVFELVLASVCLSPAFGVALRDGWMQVATALPAWSALGMLPGLLLERESAIVVFGLLLAANEANLLIRWSLGRLHLKPGPYTNPRLDPQEFNRGRVIGLVERVLIFAFVFGGHFGAVGFTLAAKGFTRFKDLENRSFAEYVLIGTLLSSGLAMLAALLAKTLM